MCTKSVSFAVSGLLALAMHGAAAEPKRISIASEMLDGDLWAADMAFSPSGHFLAALMQSGVETRHSELVILALPSATVEHRLPLPGATYTWQGPSLSWSSDESMIASAVQRPGGGGQSAFLYDLRSRSRCEVFPIAQFGGFLESEKVAVSVPRKVILHDADHTAVRLFDKSCKEIDKVPLRMRPVQLSTMAPGGRLLAADREEWTLIQPSSRETLASGRVPYLNAKFRVGNDGHNVCIGHVPASANDVLLTCTSTEGVAALIRTPIRWGFPFDVALGSGIVVAADQKLKRTFLPFDTKITVFRWIVYDLQSRAILKEVVHVGQRNAARADKRVTRSELKVESVAVSPDGTTIAIGRDENIYLHEVPGAKR